MLKSTRGALIGALLGGFGMMAGHSTRTVKSEPKPSPEAIKDMKTKAAEKRKRRQERNLRLSGQK